MATGADLNIALSMCIGYIWTVNKAWNHAKRCLVCTVRTTLVWDYAYSYHSHVNIARSEMVTSDTRTVALHYSPDYYGGKHVHPATVHAV